MEIAPGTVVRDNLRLRRPLAEGAMGAVWAAEHGALGTEVAVKFLAEPLAVDNREALARFLREARAAAQIKSPHIAQIFDQGVMDDGTPYIVMELLAGETLRERLERGPLALSDAARIVAELARALTAAHRAGVVHRDIKPDNVFLARVDDEVMVKVIDFGIAKQPELPRGMMVTGGGMMLGTPEYMSPEQVMSSRDVDHRADLWAMAVVAYEMLLGVRPFTGRDLGELCCKLLKGEHPKPSAIEPTMGPEVDAWFARAFAVESQSRFASAKEMARSFAALGSERTQAVPADAPPPPPRGWTLLGGALAASVALGGALAALATSPRLTEEARAAGLPLVIATAATRPRPPEARAEAPAELSARPPAAPSLPAAQSWHDERRGGPRPAATIYDDPGF